MRGDKNLDTDFEDHQLEEVNPTTDGLILCLLGGTTIFCPHGEEEIAPEVGDSIRIYGSLGYQVRGIDIAGKEVFYRSKSQQEIKDRRDIAQAKLESIVKFYKEEGNLNDRYRALPDPFRKRLDRFRRNNGDFRWQSESYELFVCEEGIRIADRLRDFYGQISKEHMKAFRNMGREEQVCVVPGLSTEHSMNTLACSTFLAYFYVKDPEVLVKYHAAMCPIVGCRESGCTSKE